MNLILTLHSLLRWAVVLVALAAIFQFSLGWAQKRHYDSLSRALASAFGALMDSQLLFGLLYFFWNGASFSGGFALRHRWEHLALMLVAVLVAHLPSRWKSAPSPLRYRNGLFAILFSLLLVVAGVFALPGNRWLTIFGL
jgi:hypothetical protein